MSGEAINLGLMLFVSADGTVLPITNLLNPEGQDCEADEAVAFVAGQGDVWVTDVLEGYQGVEQ